MLAYLLRRFLLARIYLGFLEDKPNIAAVRSALRKFKRHSPESGENKKLEVLNDAYDETMKRIEQQKPGLSDLAKKTLAWITYAQRQLTTVELQHALAVEVDDSEFDRDRVTGINRIVSVCSGLVAINKESGIIQLVHYTTQKYFEQMIETWFPNAQYYITGICVTYLSFSAFETGPCRTDDEFEARLKSNELYDYTARHWGNHAREASSVHPKVLKFLQYTTKVEAAAQAMLARKNYFWNDNRIQLVPKQITGLHLAAFFGIAESVTVILQSTYVDSKDTNGRTPLSWAAGRGHEAVVRLLVDTGKADINSKNNNGWTPLMWAAGRGREAVVKLLADTGEADINSKIKFSGPTSLLLAAMEGREAVVRLLMDTGKADIDSKDKNGWTPLSLAATGGHEAVVRLLMDTGKAYIHSKDKNGWTPLFWAAAEGHEAVVRLLVDTGKADIHSKDKYGWTPLMWAATGRHEAVVRLLKSFGAS
jgi:ankyrin repeat protein